MLAAITCFQPSPGPELLCDLQQGAGDDAISPTVRDDRAFRAPKGVTQALALVLADGHGHGSSGGGGIGVLLLILLIVWVLAR
jgi:hypothetical protein